LKYSKKYLQTDIDEATIKEVGEFILNNSKSNDLNDSKNESSTDNSTEIVECEECDNEIIIGNIEEIENLTNEDDSESI
jgi:hypothetical protein